MPLQPVGAVQRDRKAYDDVLEATQRGGLDVSRWVAGFLQTLLRAWDAAHHAQAAVLKKARFWRRHGAEPLNARQIKLLDRVLDGFDGPLSSGGRARMASCSPDIALRDITDLLARGTPVKAPGGGRSSAYLPADLRVAAA